MWPCVPQLTSLSFILLICKMGTVIPHLTTFQSFSKAHSTFSVEKSCVLVKGFLGRKFSEQRTPRSVPLESQPRIVSSTSPFRMFSLGGRDTYIPQQTSFVSWISNLQTTWVMKLKRIFLMWCFVHWVHKTDNHTPLVKRQ